MAHAPARRRRDAGDEAHDRLLDLRALQEIGAVDRIAADADAGGLAEASRGRLRHRFIGERARARDDADLAALVDMARHDADLALARRYDPRTIGAYEARL